MKRILLPLFFLLTTLHVHADDWMARLSDYVYLDQLSLPGTHDSATGEGFTGFLGTLGGNSYGRTQDLGISGQWDAGIRVFDLRPAVSGSNLKIFHGVLETKASLQSALNAIRDAVKAHPTEFAVVLMRHETEGDDGNSNWADLVRQCLESNDYRPWLADFKPTLTVGELRGKILILSRDTYGDNPIGGYISGISHEADFDSQCRANIRGTGGSTVYCQQDYYDCSGTDGKQIKSNAITAMLDYSTTQSLRSDSEHRWFCNNTSGYSKTTKLLSYTLSTSDGYRDNASTQNPLVISYLNEHPGVTGFVMMDFAGKDESSGYKVSSQALTQALIDNNFRHEPEVSWPARLDLYQQHTEWGTQYGSILPVDLRSNARTELIIGAYNHSGTDEPRYNTMLQQAGANRWTETASPFNAADRPSFTPCDMNGDGNIDIVVFETLGRDAANELFRSGVTTEGIYLGNGDATFTLQPIRLTAGRASQRPDTYNPNFKDPRQIVSGTVADVNNDGRPDIIGVGINDNNVVLINMGNTYFMPLTLDSGSDYGNDGRDLECAVVYAADFNSDGWTDILVSANENNGPNTGHDRERFTELYLNDGTGTHFQRTYWADRCPSLSNGGIAIADFDEDGFLDIFCQGPGGFWPGTDYARQMTGNESDGYWDHCYLLLNDGTGRYNVAPTTQFDQYDLRNQNSTPAGANAYDWNGDGHIDIIYQGWSPELSRQTGFIWLNDGKGHFSRDLRFAAGSEAATCLADWNGDSRKDIISTGFCEDPKYLDDDQRGRTFTVTLGTSALTTTNNQPTEPKAYVSGNSVTFTWTPNPRRTQQNLTYELYIQDSQGTLLANPKSYTTSSRNGRRKTEDFGNLGTVNSITYTLPDGDYTWGVQAINGQRSGSRYATGTFTIGTSGISEQQADRHEPITETARYNLLGQPVPDNYRGTVIIHYSDGTTRKAVR